MKKFKNLTKKSRIMILSSLVFLLVAILIASVSVIVLNSKKAPKISVELFPQPDNKILVSWNKKNTKSYLIEYFYSLDQEQEAEKIQKSLEGQSMSKDEITKKSYDLSIKMIDTNETKIELPRKRGNFKVRVKAIGQKSKHDTAFSDWFNIDIPAYKLETPSFLLAKNENGYVYIKDFQSSTYAIDASGNKDVEFYEFKDSIDSFEVTLSKHKINGYEFGELPDGINKLTAYIRAVNYEQAIDTGTKNTMIPLYWLYEPSDWCIISIDL